MYAKLFKSPLRFSRAVAEKILRRLFLRYNSLGVQEEGDLLLRFLDAMCTFFSRIRKSLISDQYVVSHLEGPSSRKLNDLMVSMVDDISNTYVQQNAIDKSLVETHNLLDIQRAAIEAALKTASEGLTDLFAITSSVDAAVVIFEDSFNTRNKHDEAFPTALEQADIDIVAGIIRLASGAKYVPEDFIQDRQVRVSFDGEPIEKDNTFSWGKLYGDPRDLGENGIRATFKVPETSEDDVAQGEKGQDPDLPGRPGGKGDRDLY